MDAMASRGGSRKGRGRSLPFPYTPLLLSLSPLSPLPLALQLGGPLNQLQGLGEHCKLPSGVWGGAPAENEFYAL